MIAKIWIVVPFTFANEYFDAVISVDAYQYFGGEVTFIDDKLAPLVKQGGVIALAIPGFKQGLYHKMANLPSEFLHSWKVEDLETFHSCEWWEKLFTQSTKIKIQSIKEMECFETSWNDWLSSTSI